MKKDRLNMNSRLEKCCRFIIIWVWIQFSLFTCVCLSLKSWTFIRISPNGRIYPCFKFFYSDRIILLVNISKMISFTVETLINLFVDLYSLIQMYIKMYDWCSDYQREGTQYIVQQSDLTSVVNVPKNHVRLN